MSYDILKFKFCTLAVQKENELYYEINFAHHQHKNITRTVKCHVPAMTANSHASIYLK